MFKQLIGFEQSDQTEFSVEHWFNHLEFKKISWKTEFYVLEHFRGYAIICEAMMKK